MKERSIPFRAQMVRAILDGSKMQTRRIMKLQPPQADGILQHHDGIYLAWDDKAGQVMDVGSWKCPYGQPGDRLWVREAWRASSAHDDIPPSQIPVGDSIEYLCDRDRILTGRGRPGMFMPRWASRITLAVTGMRVERLQDISEADAIAEGVEQRIVGSGWREYGLDPLDEAVGTPPLPTAKASYRSLWESINGAGSWDANPWVWMVEFRRVKK